MKTFCFLYFSELAPDVTASASAATFHSWNGTVQAGLKKIQPYVVLLDNLILHNDMLLESRDQDTCRDLICSFMRVTSQNFMYSNA